MFLKTKKNMQEPFQVASEWPVFCCSWQKVNAANNGDLRCVRAIESVNEAVMNNDAKALFEAIHSPDLNLAEHLHGDDYFVNNRLFVSEDDAVHVLGILREIQQNRSLVRAFLEKTNLL